MDIARNGGLIRSSMVAVASLLLVAACASGGGTLSSSAPALTVGDATPTLASPSLAAVASCPPKLGYTTGSGGTRVDDAEDGFAITLPDGWAQIDLGSGAVVAAFSDLTMKRGTADLVKAIGSGAKRDGYEFLAVDLGRGGSSLQSEHPADLLVDLSGADGDTLDSIATDLTSDLRADGVTGDIEQVRFRFAGGDGLGVRFVEVSQDLNGQAVTGVVSYYIAVRGSTQLSLVFSVAAQDNSGSTTKFDAIAQSIAFPVARAPGCQVQTPGPSSP
jgi:hypothetical protein